MSTEEFDPYKLPYYDPITDRRVAFVTGANSGLGYYLTLNLYMHGWVVYMACRNQKKAEQAKIDVQKEAKNRKAEGDQLPNSATFGELFLIEIDMSKLNSVEDAVKKFLKASASLDLLVNNAGVMAVPAEKTEDGFDIQLQTNHLAPFLLSRRLLPLLQQSNHGPRIVFVSSKAYERSKLDDKPDALSRGFEDYTPNMLYTWIRYANSKVAMIHDAKVFAKKYPNVLTIAVHPGVSTDTDLLRWWRSIPYLGAVANMTFGVVSRLVGITSEELCYSPLKASAYPGFTPENDNGKYLIEFGKEQTLMKKASDEKLCQQTWDWTEKTLKEAGHEV